MAHLVYGFVPLVAVADRVFRALFEIDDKDTATRAPPGHSAFGFTRP